MQEERTAEELFGCCPYMTAQKVLSGKWALMILHHLNGQTLRFGQLMKLFPEMTQATLTKQLRSLENYGLVERKVYPQVPPKVEYSLTQIGDEFAPVLSSLEVWGKKYIGQIAEEKGIEHERI